MNNVKFLLPLILLLPFSGYTQNKLRIGLTGGAVLSSLIKDSNLNASAGKFGYIAGATIKYNAGELGWFFQSGVNYTLEGDHNQNLNFVKVPLTIGLDVSEDVNINFIYNLSWQVGNQNGVQDFYKDFASIIGFGFEIYLTKNLTFGSRVNYGISNLVEVPADAKNYKVKPFTIDMYLTYFIF